MGLKFLGNPYDEEDYEDEGWDITADEEEWIQPPNVEMLGVFRLVASDMIDGDWQTMPIPGEDNSDDDEDYCPEDEDLSLDDEDDDDFSAADDDYEAEDEVQDFVNRQRIVAAGDDEDDDEDDADYVTFPLASSSPVTDLSTTESEKTMPTTSTTNSSSQSSSEAKSTSRETD